MAESEVLGTILHMARMVAVLDLVQICAWAAAVLNVGVLAAVIVRDTRKRGRKNHGQ